MFYIQPCQLSRLQGSLIKFIPVVSVKILLRLKDEDDGRRQHPPDAKRWENFKGQMR